MRMGEGAGLLSEEQRQAALEELLGNSDQRTKRASSKYGKSLRKAVPRDVFSAWRPPVGRPDPMDQLMRQDDACDQDLAIARRGRMSSTPYAFFRGAACVMASDLSALPTTGIEVQICGDAQVSNFGLFLVPGHRMVFDMRDFDETTRGPWEWDVARLAASIEISGRDRGLSPSRRREAVLAAVRSYRETMRLFADEGNLEVWHARLDASDLARYLASEETDKRRKKAEKARTKAKASHDARAVGKLTKTVDGGVRVVSDSPLVVPLRDVIASVDHELPEDLGMAMRVSSILAQHRQTLSSEGAALLRRYKGVDVARKVVGVGGARMRTWVIVMQGSDSHDTLVLQAKEATDSVLERYIGQAPQDGHGRRVVEGQRSIQAEHDMLLGWTSVAGTDGAMHDYYVRQLWEEVGPLDLDLLGPKGLRTLACACGWTLAHAHARTGNRFAIASYLGGSDRFDEAVLTFSQLYANQNEQDFAQFAKRSKEAH